MPPQELWRVRLGRSDNPSSPKFKILGLPERLRDPILFYLETTGLQLPARGGGWSLWIDPPHYSQFIAKCAELPNPDDPDDEEQPWRYIIEVQLPAIRAFKVARGVAFYHDREIMRRLGKHGFSTGMY